MIIKNSTGRTLGGSHQNHQRTTPFAQIEEMDSGWSDWYAVGTTSHDSSVYKSGSASIKIVNGSGAANAGMRKNITDGDWTRNGFKFYVRSDDWSNVTNFEVLLSTSGSFSEYFTLNLKDFLTSPPNDTFIEINCTTSDFSNTTGSASWGTVNDMIIRSKATAATTPTVWIDGFVRYPITTKGCVSIVFDDGWDSQYTQGKLKMDAYNFPGTAYVIWDTVGTTNYMTQSQIEGLAAAGWDIGGHGGTNLTSLTEKQVEYDLLQMRNYLDEYGFKGADNYALPNGAYNDTVLKQVHKYFGTARSIDGLRQSCQLVPKRPSAISVSNATSTATLQGYIDKAIANGDWVIITFHKIVTTATVDTEYSIANFGTFIDYVATSGIEVLTVSDAIERGMSGAGNLFRVHAKNTIDAASVQVGIFEGDRPTAATNDEGYFSFRLSDSAGTQTEFARVSWVATDVTDASEDGRLDFGVMTAGTLADELSLTGAALYPATSDGLALGSTANQFSDLFLAEGGVINWDNGDATITQSGNTLTIDGATLVLDAGTTTEAPLKFVSGSLLTTAEDGAIEMDGDCFYGTVDAGNRGVIPVVHIIRQDSTHTLANSGSSQKLFDASTNGELTLELGTYIFECIFSITGMSATSGNAQLSLLGTAVLAAPLQFAQGRDVAADAATGTVSGTYARDVTLPQIITAATATEMYGYWRGTFEVFTAGTLVPSITLTTAVGTAVVAVGSYFLCYRVGSTSLTTVGQWT